MRSAESLSFKANLRIPSAAIATVSGLGNQSGARRTELSAGQDDAVGLASGVSALQYCVNNDLI